MIDIKCPTCSTQYRISDSQLANVTKLRCKKCNTVFQLRDQIKPQERSEAAPDAATLSFDLSKIQLDYPVSHQDDETLSHDAASNASPPQGHEMFGALFPEAAPPSETEEDVEIEDHISAPLQQPGPQSTDFSSFSFSFDQAESGEQELSESPTMDFSFSAAIPDEAPAAEEEGEGEGEQSEEPLEEGEESPSPGQNLDLHLGAVEIAENLTGELPITVAFDQQAEEASFPAYGTEEGVSDEYAALEEELSTCCIDSLAMGLSRCELCGRDLRGKDPRIAQELQKRRRQQLKQELSGANVQIGFSEEQLGEIQHRHVHVTEDFSDVEKALDDLASGTFHHTLKKKEAKKQFQKTLQKMGAGAIGLIILAGIVFLFLLPSHHEKLQARYKTLMEQEETDSETLVELFFDAILANDQDIFNQLSVISALPEYSSAKIITVGEEYEQTSIGIPGKKKEALEKEIVDIEEQIQEKSSLVQEYSAKNLSPSILEEKIATNQQKLMDIQQEFDQKDEDNRKKVDRLQADLQDIDRDLKKARDDIRKYIDKTDDVGKAIYNRAITNQQFLNEKKNKLLTQLREEQKKYQQLHADLEKEYHPQFRRLQERLTTEKALLREANQLQDKKNSPVVLLTKDIEQLSQTLTVRKEELEKTSAQLSQAVAFFAHQPEYQEIVNQQQEIEFSHVSKNVAATIKETKGGEGQISVVLKQYQALFPEGKTIQSRWLVEKIAK